MVIYNVPRILAESYRGHNIIVRADSTSELLGYLNGQKPDKLVYVQLTSLSSTSDLLKTWKYPVPLDLVMTNPKEDFPKLYQYADLASYGPVRVSIQVISGFSKAVKLATSLNFAVKLRIAQPDHALVNELMKVLDLYLHRSTVCEPIEFFHSLLETFYRENFNTIWAIQEEDPAEFRYITDQGEEVISERITELPWKDSLENFSDKLKQKLQSEGGECSNCEFLGSCCGYFKWPRREYSCQNIKPLLKVLRQAAEELKRDLANCHQSES